MMTIHWLGDDRAMKGPHLVRPHLVPNTLPQPGSGQTMAPSVAKVDSG